MILNSIKWVLALLGLLALGAAGMPETAEAAYSIATVTENGSTNILTVPFPYINQSDVQVFVPSSSTVPLAASAYTWLTSSTIQLNTYTPSALNGVTVKVQRVTQITTADITFQTGALDPNDLNTQALQNLYSTQELWDQAITGTFTPPSFGPGVLTALALAPNTTGGMATLPLPSSSLQAGAASANLGILPYANRPNRIISPFDYGNASTCNGSQDDNTAINAGIAAAGVAGGGTEELPSGTCTASGTVSLTPSNVRLVGQGSGATVLKCTGTGTADCIQMGSMSVAANCVGVTPPNNCQQSYKNEVSQMDVLAVSRTGGFLFNVDGESQGVIRDVGFTGWDMLETQDVNTLLLQHLSGYTNATSGFAIYNYNAITTGTANNWYRTDAIIYRDLVINSQNKGATCMEVDGAVNTVRIFAVALLGCGPYALRVDNSAHSGSYYPQFFLSDDLEIDGVSGTAVDIEAGSDFQFVNANWDSISAPNGTTILTVEPDLGYSYTRGISISNSEIHDGPGSAAFLNGRNISLSGDQFFDINHANTGRPDLEFGPNSDDILVTGSFVGQRFGDPNAPAYGVSIDAGATHDALDANNYTGATTGNVFNNSSNTISFQGGTGFNGAAITTTTCAATTTC